MIRRPPRSTPLYSSAASDVYKRQPETQIEIRTDLGVFWADMGWREWRLLAEYDGRAKYEANGSASEAVVQEKRRQEAIEACGWRVLRITKEDLRAPALLLRRIARLL